MGWIKELVKAAVKAAEKPLEKVGVKLAAKSAESAEKTVGKALANSVMKEGRYASKASYTKWIESMGGKVTKVESGFKNWEKSLSKSKSGFKTAEHLGAKAAQRQGVSSLTEPRPLAMALLIPQKRLNKLQKKQPKEQLLSIRNRSRQ